MLANPPGFLLIWDADGEQIPRWMAWAEARGANALFSSSPVVALGFGDTTNGPTVWSNDHGTGVFFGELYAPLSESSGGKPPSAETPSNHASVLAATYANEGSPGFRSLNGIFCAVVWDEKRQTLVLFRDASCAHPLYWMRAEGWAAAATRLDLLVDLPGVEKGVGAPGLVEYLRFLDVSPPNTLYSGIRSLEPGVPASFSGKDLEYDHAAPSRKPRDVATQNCIDASFQASVDALDEALRQSVAERLLTTEQTGISLSGGVDSSLMCAIGASQARERVTAFTLGFDEEGFDESPTARALAGHFGIEHRNYVYSLEDYAARFKDFVSRIDLPFADPAGLPTRMFFEDCRKHTDVLLDGTGADTLVGVMPARHTRIATQYVARIPNAVRRFVGRLLDRVPIATDYAAIWDFDTPEDLLIRWKGWKRQEIESLCGRKVSLEHTRFFRLYRTFPKDAHFERYSALLGNLPDDRVHQAAELTGLKVRFPYFDQRVEAAIADLPLGFRFTDEEPKRLLRAVLARYAPRALWDLPKHGLDFPFLALLRHNDYQLVRRYLSPELLGRFDTVTPDMVTRYVEDFIGGKQELAFRVWALVVLFGWLEHHFAAN
jgi:asparagine synthase (glutamine-hydrolysing)